MTKPKSHRKSGLDEPWNPILPFHRRKGHFESWRERAKAYAAGFTPAHPFAETIPDDHQGCLKACPWLAEKEEPPDAG